MSTTRKIESTDSMDNSSEWGQYVAEGDSEHGDSPSPVQHQIKHTSSTDSAQDTEKVDTETDHVGSPKIKSSGGSARELRRAGSGSGSGSFMAKQMALVAGQQSLNKGLTSSPSFQELERAIGAQLALGLNSDSNQSLEGLGKGLGGGRGGIMRSKGSQNQLSNYGQRSSPSSPRRSLSGGSNFAAYTVAATAR